MGRVSSEDPDSIDTEPDMLMHRDLEDTKAKMKAEKARAEMGAPDLVEGWGAWHVSKNHVAPGQPSLLSNGMNPWLEARKKCLSLTV